MILGDDANIAALTILVIGESTSLLISNKVRRTESRLETSSSSPSSSKDSGDDEYDKAVVDGTERSGESSCLSLLYSWGTPLIVFSILFPFIICQLCLTNRKYCGN